MLQRIHISGYRSLLDLDCTLADSTVIAGKNGVGKSNFYKALLLVKALANGTFSEAIAREGGMLSALWAGYRKNHEKKTISILIEHSEFTYTVEIGLIPRSPTDPTLFRTDPDIKHERVSIHLPGGNRVIAKRTGTSLMLSEETKSMAAYDFPILANESLLSQVKNPAKFPFLSLVRETILEWRFFHEFDTSSHSILRKSQVSYYSPFLNDNGSNLLSALQTIIESNNEKKLQSYFQDAFPQQRINIEGTQNEFYLEIHQNGLKRPLRASEVSDGTLRFLCLLAALLSPHSPGLLIFNEPEMSLNKDVYSVLSSLLTSTESQLIVVSHDQYLADQLTDANARSIQLITKEGATIHQSHLGAKKVWDFE